MKTGVQIVYNHSKILDSGACPGLDPGSAGMTEKRILRIFTRSSKLLTRIWTTELDEHSRRFSLYGLRRVSIFPADLFP